MQVGNLIGGKQRPLRVSLNPLHEQIRHPVGGVHVVRAAAVVAGILAQIEEFLDVDVPCLEIGADCPFALAALIDGNGRVVRNLQEGDDALRLAVRPIDVCAKSAHTAPVIAEPASVFRQQRIVLDGFEDAV